MNTYNHLKTLYDAYLTGRALIKESFLDLRAQQEANMLVLEADGSVKTANLGALECKLRQYTDGSIKGTKTAAILGVMSHPYLAGHIVSMLTQAKKN